MGTVQLRLGDIFDGPSDLIVFPCSTAGTVTPFVQQRLINYRIPNPQPGLKIGEISILDFEGADNIAQYVAFAISVHVNSTSEKAIYEIGKQLGKATYMYSSIRLIAAPLLGTGAGALNMAVAAKALSAGFKKSAHPESNLILHVLPQQRWFYDEMAASPNFTRRTRQKQIHVPPRVFISYSHGSAEHDQWVQELACFLRENGVDARLDKWHLRAGMDLPQFMTNELRLADRVILVSDKNYAEKADGRLGGVGWETMIIQGDLYKLPSESTKYLVIVRSPEISEGLPRYLQTKYAVHWPGAVSESKSRDLILRELYNITDVPQIGMRPVFL